MVRNNADLWLPSCNHRNGPQGKCFLPWSRIEMDIWKHYASYFSSNSGFRYLKLGLPRHSCLMHDGPTFVWAYVGKAWLYIFIMILFGCWLYYSTLNWNLCHAWPIRMLKYWGKLLPLLSLNRYFQNQIFSSKLMSNTHTEVGAT